jgi:hypothetical protein
MIGEDVAQGQDVDGRHEAKRSRRPREGRELDPGIGPGLARLPGTLTVLRDVVAIDLGLRRDPVVAEGDSEEAQLFRMERQGLQLLDRRVAQPVPEAHAIPQLVDGDPNPRS